MSDTEDGPAMVPSARLREETSAKRAAMARAAELEAELAVLSKRASTADTLAKQLEEERTRYSTASSSWEAERAVYQLGITDPEAIEVARHLHGRLPEQGRPALADWLRSAKEDPSKAPRALVPYLAQPAPTPAPATSAATSSTALGSSPSPSAASSQRPGATAPAAAATQLDAGQIRALYQEAARTGDWSKWDAVRSSIRGRG